jgi:DNA-binding MarR family transcriptional regulator
MDEPRWLTPAELRAWLAWVATTTLLDGALDRQLQRESGMPHTYYLILAMLSDAPEHTLRMSELASATQSSQSRLSHAVTRLEREGWVCRRPCPDDRRSTFATLTAEGFAALREAAPGHVRTVRDNMFDALSAEQVEQLEGICRAMLGRLTRDPEAVPIPGVCPAEQR